MSDNTRRNLISILIGLGTGLFMSILVLYMMITSYFNIMSLSFVLTVTAACAVPFCLTFLRKTEWNVFLAQIVMILTSFAITVIYGFYVTYAGETVSAYSSFWTQVLAASALAHGLSLGLTVLGELLHRHGMNKNRKS